MRPTAINPKIQKPIYPFLARARSSKQNRPFYKRSRTRSVPGSGALPDARTTFNRRSPVTLFCRIFQHVRQFWCKITT